MNPKMKKALPFIIGAAVLVVLAVVIIVLAVNCNSGNKTVYDNENDALVFSTLEVDKVFNPFFSTSGTDSNVVGMTQISMISNDKKGNPVWGDDEAVVAKDVEIRSNGGTADVDLQTTYYFVLKNNVRFSNGSYLTIKDVLFNLYVYLDPVYTGSSTIYSTDIVGLKEYRTQTADEEEQKNFMLQFETKATARIEALVGAAESILEDDANKGLDAAGFRTKLAEYRDENGSGYAHIVEDFDKALSLFREELENDWSNALNSYDSITFTDKNGVIYKGNGNAEKGEKAALTTDVEAFLYNEGYITWNKKDGKLEYGAGDAAAVKTWTKERAIEFVYNANVPDKIGNIVQYWATASNLLTYLTNTELEESFRGQTRRYENISGIRFANRTGSVTVNGTEYGVPTYAEDGHVTSGNEVLSITINNVDPKAIWNFAFAVAPMYYYSDEAHINAFDFESNFGVEYASPSFMNDVVKNPSKIGVPVGAGAYAASKSSGGLENVGSGDFYDKGVIYFERNPYYLMGTPVIKKVRFQVVSAQQMLTTLYSKAIDFVEPNAKPETIDELDQKKSEGIGYKRVQTSGYGYIGINAGKVPDMSVRQAIMHSINTQECVNYYQNTATAIHRSMSIANWAYPTGATSYYPYIGGEVPEDLSVVNPAYREYVTRIGVPAGKKLSEDQQKEFIRLLVEDAGYSLNADGVYQKGDHVLKYTFTIAGEETDHPAWQALWHAGEFLNQNGFDITVTTDANALKKLATGELTVWAAAWGSTIDPDMYQVYHKDSTATSTWNWGYRQIKQNVGGKYDVENALIDDLSELIDKARRTNDQKLRYGYYSQALDIVMQLAIELPTYQRDDLFAYNAGKIDTSTFTPDADLSPFKGLTSDLWRVSLITER